MSDLMRVLDQVVSKAFEDGDEWEIGDEGVFILNDGVVIVSINESEDNGERELGVKVVAGEPTRLNLNLNLIQSK